MTKVFINFGFDVYFIIDLFLINRPVKMEPEQIVLHISNQRQKIKDKGIYFNFRPITGILIVRSDVVVSIMIEVRNSFIGDAIAKLLPVSQNLVVLCVDLIHPEKT